MFVSLDFTLLMILFLVFLFFFSSVQFFVFFFFNLARLFWLFNGISSLWKMFVFVCFLFFCFENHKDIAFIFFGAFMLLFMCVSPLVRLLVQHFVYHSVWKNTKSRDINRSFIKPVLVYVCCCCCFVFWKSFTAAVITAGEDRSAKQKAKSNSTTKCKCFVIVFN